jgi:hypothetical protein
MSTAGASHELGHYELPDGTKRVLRAQRVDGRVAISDIPSADDGGRVYLVERHIESQAAMQGIVGTYIKDSIDRGEPAILVPSWLGGDR